jgi:hypothetical protein
MAKTPKVGDQRPLGKCTLCGGTEYEVYGVTREYGGDTYHWKMLRHEYYERKLCIAELARRIEALEPKKRGKK